MNREQIREIALQCGFKLKEQDDGSLDLNEYVYRFADLMFAAGYNAGYNSAQQPTYGPGNNDYGRNDALRDRYDHI